MKSGIKKLYKKDPKLAIQAAKVLGYKIIKAAKINLDKVKKGSVLGIGSLFSKKVSDYIPIKYTVNDVLDINNYPNLKEKQGLTHIFHLLSIKKRPLVLDVFNNRYYILMRGTDFKTINKGKIEDIKLIKY